MDEINILCKSLLFASFATIIGMGIIFFLLMIGEKIKKYEKE